MAYRLSIADEVPSSVRTCAREQLAGAIERLQRADEDPVKAVHEARKHLKKTRALLRLVRPALGKPAYRRENDTLRDAGLALSGTRDADVLVQTVGKLADHAAGRLPADTFDQLRDALAAQAAVARSVADGEPVPELANVIELLQAAELRVEAWPLDEANWETVLAGVARAYSRGRDAFAVARGTPEPELLHAWRKRAKDLWYHQRLLAPAWPDVLGAQAEAAHTLTELLGDDHDLAVLAARLSDDTPSLPPVVDADRAALLTLVEHRSDELRTAATQLGHRIYAEAPKAFTRRLTRYVQVAVEEAQIGVDPA
ncbi:MAG TPA: CHAD domain-containing protein [Conexibacter sp.]|jgi:CHAD domain-containing protein|nr:CHAD domain-containing protein [Conexibacter sp.]